jgi:hypothetical protein
MSLLDVVAGCRCWMLLLDVVAVQWANVGRLCWFVVRCVGSLFVVVVRCSLSRCVGSLFAVPLCWFVVRFPWVVAPWSLRRGRCAVVGAMWARCVGGVFFAGARGDKMNQGDRSKNFFRLPLDK